MRTQDRVPVPVAVTVTDKRPVTDSLRLAR